MESKQLRKIYLYLRGEEKGEHRIGFTHKDFKATRRVVLREWVTTTLILSVAILGILSLFWGAFIHVKQNLKSLEIIVVNFDLDSSGIVGNNVVGLAESLAKEPQPQAGWKVVPPERFNHDPQNVRLAVYNFDVWAAITIQPNASSALRRAAENGDSSYDPTTAAEIVYVGARDTYAIPNAVVPALGQFTLQATSQVGAAWTKAVLRNSTISIESLKAAPQTLSPAIGFTIVNLRPLGPPQVSPAVTVGALYLIVISFFSYAFFLPTHTHFISETEGHSKLYFYQLVIWKYTSAVGAYFFLSLSYSLVSLAFQVPFANSAASPVEEAINPNAYGTASFVVFWMVNWIGMIALGLASENMAMTLGQPWAALWLVFWIISNVCTAIYPIDLEPGFYRYGYAFPLHNVIEASKQILFDLHSRIGLNVGVLLAWVAVNTSLFPLCAWFFRYKHYRALAKQKR